MSRLGMYTKFTAQPGKGARLAGRLLQAAASMEHVAGCQLYIVNTSPGDADTVWVTEVWDSEEQHAASLRAEGVGEFIRETMPLIAGRPEQIRVVPIGGKGLPRASG